MQFQPGDRVAWSHAVATEHGVQSVLRRSYVEGRHAVLDDSPRFGTVVASVNAMGTWIEIALDPTDDPSAHGFDGPDQRVLTADELVKISEE